MREELYYAKNAYDVLIMPMFLKMLNWRIGTEHGFRVTTGSSCKYLKRFLSTEEMERFQGIFPDGSYENICRCLFLMYDYFHESAGRVAGHFHFYYDRMEIQRVRQFLEDRFHEKGFFI